MPKRATDYKKIAPVVDDQAIPLPLLKRYADAYSRDARLAGLSPRTEEMRTDITDKFLWFCDHISAVHCDEATCEEFLLYLRHGHEEPGGRWGAGKTHTATLKPLSPSALSSYFRWLKCFFNWLVETRRITTSPLARIPTPKKSEPLLTAPGVGDIALLLQTLTLKTKGVDTKGRKITRHGSMQPERDVAILSLLFDTGLRVSELVAVKMEHFSEDFRILTIPHGKGDKARQVHLSPACTTVLFDYLDTLPQRATTGFLFLSARGTDTGSPLTPHGVGQMIERVCKKAGISHINPHAFRRAFATQMLVSQAPIDAVQRLMGHSTPTMTLKYSKISGEELQTIHTQHSPLSKIKTKARRGRPRKP